MLQHNILVFYVSNTGPEWRTFGTGMNTEVHRVSQIWSLKRWQFYCNERRMFPIKCSKVKLFPGGQFQTTDHFLSHSLIYPGFCFEERLSTYQQTFHPQNCFFGICCLPLVTTCILGQSSFSKRLTKVSPMLAGTVKRLHHFHFSEKLMQAAIIPSQSDIT